MFDPSKSGPNLFKQILNRQIYRNSDGFQQNLFRQRFNIAKNLYRTDLVSHYGCVNAIEFSNGGEYLSSGGDDKRVLIWNVEKSIAHLEKPRVLNTEHQSNIFCLGFDKNNRKVFSGGNDDVVILHDFETGALVRSFKHVKPVLGLSVDFKNESVFATAGEDGQVLLFDHRCSAGNPLVITKYYSSFQAVQFHPIDSNYLIAANSKKGAALWDVRRAQLSPTMEYGFDEHHKSCMSVRFNNDGTLILAIRRRLPPVLYSTTMRSPICQFYNPNYYNSCTMKSCSFAGEDDEYVLSGSDDFNLYVWRVTDADFELTDQWIESTQMVLQGHRSIVNQIRYNKEKCVLASSGVEKIVKLWSPFEQKGWSGSLVEGIGGDTPREVITRDTYSSLLQTQNSDMTHDYSGQNTDEDIYMMAYFDSLIQQELEGWDSNDSSDTDTSSLDSASDSTPQSSCEDSDEEELLRYFIKKRDRIRRNNPNSFKLQRSKYTNRITYLIATKRKTLRRLALKGTSHSYQTTLCKKHRKSLRRRIRHRSGRNNSSVLRKRKRPRAGPSKSARVKRAAVFRALCKRNIRQPTVNISSDDDDDDDDDFDDDGENGPGAGGEAGGSRMNIAIPSTSTGITSSGKDAIIRLRQQQLDDDDSASSEEVEEQPQRSENEINIPPVNGRINGLVTTNNINNNNNNNHHSINDRILIGSNIYSDDTVTEDEVAQSENERSVPPVNGRVNRLVTTNNNINNNNNNHHQNNDRNSNGSYIYSENNDDSDDEVNHNNHDTDDTNDNDREICSPDSNITDRKRHAVVDIYSSHSNSRLSNNSYLDDEQDSSHSSSHDKIDHFNKKRKLSPSINNREDYYNATNNNDINSNDIIADNNNYTSNNNINENLTEITTNPNNNSLRDRKSNSSNSQLLKSDTEVNIDISIENPGCSSSASTSIVNDNEIRTANGIQSDKFPSKKLKYSKVRRNYRKNVREDSDSD